MVLPSRDKRSYIVFVNVCRWLLALVMMLSGFLKAVDPVAGMYKLQEYASAFSLTGISADWLQAAAVAQAAAEFLVGLYLLVGIYRCVVPLLALVAMLLFTPLSLYLWVDGAVGDCGCFGESIIMSNRATFVKNMILLVLAVVAFRGRRAFARNLSSRTRWILVLFSLVYIFGMQNVALQHLPLVDAGSYTVGTNLRARSWLASDVDGFSVIDWDTDVEMADELLADTGYVCIVPIESVETASVTHIDRINDLYEYCTANDIRFCAASSSGEDGLSLWAKRTGAEYPVYWADGVMLRSMVRSNPGLVMLKDGVIVGKWAAADIPGGEELENSPLPMSATMNLSNGQAREWTFWVFVLAGALVLLSLLDAALSAIGRRKRAGVADADAPADEIVENK